MHFYKTPAFIQRLFPGLIWKIKTENKEVYLTFDDGPIPGVPDWVLDTLAEYDVKATFFVVGENVQNNPVIYSRILEEGHFVGNHTFNHLNPWKHKKSEYIKNVQRCNHVMNLKEKKRLFRPPHGKLTPGVVRTIKKDHSIIMWDVLTGDYDSSISNEGCLENSLQSTSPGSIVVFHDSYKSEKKLKWVLPRYIEDLSQKGYSFHSMAS